MLNEIFKNLKVVELANVLAGPAVGMFFSELGADVYKIENRRSGGDLTRQWKLPHEDAASPVSSYYHSVNWNKKVLSLDLFVKEERAELERLIEEADVLILNFKKGDAAKFDLEPGRLSQRFPSLVVAELSGFEDGGERVAYDAVLQAETGWMSINGEPGASPLKLPLAFIDLLAAHQLKEGILLALLRKAGTGRGAVVRTSLYRSAIASLANQASAYLNTGEVPKALGSLHPTIAPYGELFACEEGEKVLLAIGTDKQFRDLCSLLEVKELAENAAYATNVERVRNRRALYALLEPCFRTRKAETFLESCHARKIPAGKVRNLDEVFKEDSARKMILEQKEADGSISKRVATVAFEIDGDG
ncbi:MAG: CoA transferase [Bacteroidia bacterium]|nr:CoA transferase [Bacteroidia bacterium]